MVRGPWLGKVPTDGHSCPLAQVSGDGGRWCFQRAPECCALSGPWLASWPYGRSSVKGAEGQNRPAIVQMSLRHLWTSLLWHGGRVLPDEGCGLGSLGSLTTCSNLSLFLVWEQDICLKMAFMKSVVQVTTAIKNIKDLEDFQFAQKMTLTGIIIVSWVGGFLGVGRFLGLTAGQLLLGQRFSELLGASEEQGVYRVPEAPPCLRSASIPL